MQRMIDFCYKLCDLISADATLFAENPFDHATHVRLVVRYLPWLLSSLSVYMTWMSGNMHKRTWLVGLANQFLWLAWILASEGWGFLPLNAALWIVYFRNHMKWRKLHALK